MLHNSMSNRKSGGLVLAGLGLAAFAYYKYSKMTAQEKASLTSTIREKGESLMKNILPAGLKSRMDGTTA